MKTWGLSRLYGMVGLAWIVACGASGGGRSGNAGGNGGTNSTTECENRSGTYLVQYTEHSGGTCGPLAEYVFVAEEQADAGDAPGCDFEATVSADNCTVTNDGECEEPAIGEGVTSLNEITTEWNRTGSRAEGEYSLIVRRQNGEVVCRSTYDATYTRQ